MSRRFKHRKLIVVTSLVFTSLALIFFIAFSIGKKTLKKHQISYRSLSYQFPSTLKVAGLDAAPAESLYLKLETLELSLSWSSLWKRRIILKHLFAENGCVELMQGGPSGKEEGESEEKGKGLPKFELQDIRMQAISFAYLDARDTIQASWEKLYLSSALVRDSISIDSLFLDGAYLGLFSGGKDTIRESTTSLNLEGIPQTEMNYLKLAGAEILNVNPSQKQHLNNLDLVFRGWKSTEMLNFRVDRLGFVYQDTLEVDLVLENGVLNNSLQTELSDLNLEIPGLSLQLAHSSINLEGEAMVAVTLDTSYLTVGIIRQLVPSLRTTFNPELRDDARIYLDGQLAMNGKSLHLQGLHVSMLDSTSMTLLGSFNWSEKTAMDLVLSSFHSSRSNLTSLLARKGYNRFYYWPTGIVGDINIHGGTENLEFTGMLDTDQGTLEALSRVQVSDQGRLYFLLDLRSDYIEVDSITGILPLSVPYGDLHFKLAYFSGKDTRNDTLTIRIESNRLFTMDKDINRINYNYYGDSRLDSMFASIDDEFIRTRVALVTPKTGGGETRVEGVLEHLDPHQLIPGWQEASFSGQFKGLFRMEEETFQADMNLEQLQFFSSDYKQNFPDSRIELRGQSERISLMVETGEETIVNADIGSSFPTFSFPSPDWFQQWPSTTVQMKLDLNEDLMAALTGIRSGFSLDTFVLVKNTDIWESSLTLANLSYGNFVVEDIKLKALSRADSLGGELRLSGIGAGDADLGDVALRIRGQEKLLLFDMASFYPDTGKRNFLSIGLEELDEGYALKLNEAAPPVFGNLAWDIANNKGLKFSRDLKLVSGDVAVRKDQSRVEVITDGSLIRLSIDSLDLSTLYSLATHRENLQAKVSGKAELDTRDQRADWEAGLTAWIEEIPGPLNVNISGRKEGSLLSAHVDMDHEEAKAEANVVKLDERMAYSTRLTMLDLDLLNYVPNWPEELKLSGSLSGRARGTLGRDFSADGYLVAEDLDVMHHMNSTPYRLLQDTLFLSDHQIVFRNFQIQDAEEGKLTINGSVAAFPELLVDLSVYSDSIAIVNSIDTNTLLSGHLKGFADLNVTGGPEIFRISGQVHTLPEAKIHYSSPHSFDFVDASQIVTFKKLETLEEEELEGTPPKPDPVLEWDLELSLNHTDVLIMLDEIHQEYLQIAADGQLNLRTGFGISPLIYGSLTSGNGRAFIKPPFVPELNLFIDEATLSWSGLLDEPLISLRAYDLIKASTAGLHTSESNFYELVDYKVYAVLDQVSLSEFDLQFDLETEDSDAQVLIASLPSETREAYALNLLVFGRIGTERIKGNTLLANQVTRKLNELARRNFRNAGLSFASSNALVGTDESNKRARTDLSYTLSRGFMHNKLNFSVGGSVGVYLDDFTVLPPSHLIGDVKLSYKLSETPSISLTGTRQNVYHGIIDGMVNQESLGLSYKKSYHRFTDMFGSKKGEKKE